MKSIGNDILQDNRRNRTIWAALAFQAGWINAGGFLACHRFVTHITGFATQFGYDLALFKLDDAFGMLTVPLFFLGGTMISGYYVDRQINQGKKGQFHVLFLLMAVFLSVVTLLGSIGSFGIFGQELDIVSSYVLIALLCLSSGIQNAGTSSASNSFVRTTHLTGITTDLGIGLVRVLTQGNSEKRAHEVARNQIRTLLIISFIAGSVISSFIFLKSGYIGFIFPAFVSIMLFLVAKKEHA